MAKAALSPWQTSGGVQVYWESEMATANQSKVALDMTSIRLTKLMALPDRTKVYCGHEYTLSNIRFALAAEPDNAAIADWEREAAAQRARGEVTLPSTIAREKAANPFVRCDQPGVIASASKRAGRALADATSVLAEIRDWKNHF